MRRFLNIHLTNNFIIKHIRPIKRILLLITVLTLATGGMQAQRADSAEVVRYMRLAGLKPLFGTKISDTTIESIRITALPPGGHPLFVRVDFNYNTEVITWHRGRALVGQNSESGILNSGRYLLPNAEGYSLSEMSNHAISPAIPEGSGEGMPFMVDADFFTIYRDSSDVSMEYFARTLLSLADSLSTDLLIYSPSERYGVKEAQFPGGEKACDAFVASKGVYPPKALRNYEDNIVRLKIIVESDGTLTPLAEPQYWKDEYGFYAEAERLLTLMPRWEPAQKDGRPVRSLAECAFRFHVPDSLKPAYGQPLLETHRDSICWHGIYHWYLQHTLHPDSYEPYYYMASNYYDEFMLPLVPVTEPSAMDSDLVMNLHIGDFSNNYDRTPVVASPADSALKYYYLFLDHRPETAATYGYNDTLGKLLCAYIPIRQLERYLGLPHNPLNRLPFDTVPGLHYPYSVFCDVADDALPVTYDRCDNFDLSDSYFWVQSLSRDLKLMSEPVLYDTTLAPGDTVLRFAFYPSFDPPLSFRIEKNFRGVMLYWKKLEFSPVEVGLDAEGFMTYDFVCHPREGQRRLSARKYRRLMQLFEPLHFNSLPCTYYRAMIDGANWTIERRTADTFKIYMTNLAGDKIGELYDYLIKLAHIKAKYAREYCH